MRLIGLLLVLWLLLPIPAAVASEGGGQQGWGWLETIGRWTNLLILLGVILYFVRQPLRKFFADRRTGIGKEIREAAEAGERVQAETQEAEGRLRRLDQVLEQIRQEAEREAQSERERIIGEAEREAARILEVARRDIDGMRRAAQKQLQEYVAQLAVDLAEQQIRRDLSEQDERRVIDRFVSELAGKKET